MTEEFIVGTISNVGIPAALCFYVLFVLNKNVAKLTDAFNTWCHLIEQRIEHLENEVRSSRRD
ncbi:MAG: hypothetical protein IJG33_13490 [Selenomonadaceae bacterium]|nr:hypothetical protein [Selenomonadaceae bacterium]